MTTFSKFRSIVTGPAAAVGAALACVPWLMAFRDAFATGATWSGLNPGGGGPGFTILLTAGAVSFFTRPRPSTVTRATTVMVHAGFLAAVCGFAFHVVVTSMGLLPSDALSPLTSGVIAAFFVPRAAASVLEESWVGARSR